MKKWIFLSLILIPNLVFASFSLGTPASSALQVAGTSLTYSLACSLGDVLVIGVQHNGWSGNPTVSFNGVSMSVAQEGHESGSYSGIFYLLTPDSGSHDVVVTTSGSRYTTSGGVCVSGADTSMIGASSKANGVSTQVLNAITTLYSDSLVFDSVYQNNNSLTYTPLGTSLYAETVITDGEKGLGQYISFSSSGSNNVIWDISGSDTWQSSALELLPAGGTPTTTPTTTPDSLLVHYGDFLFVSQWVIFLLALIVLGLFFSVFKSTGKIKRR